MQTEQKIKYNHISNTYNSHVQYFTHNTERWLSKDPIGIAGGLNQYVFCGNNPVNFTDPLGLYWKDNLPSDPNDPLKITDDDLFEEMNVYYNKKLQFITCPKDLWGSKGDTTFYQYSSRKFEYDGKIYTGEEVNYIGVGMGSRHVFGGWGYLFNDGAVCINNWRQRDWSKLGEHKFMRFGFRHYNEALNEDIRQLRKQRFEDIKEKFESLK